MKLMSYNVQWFRGVDGVVDPARTLNAARAFSDFDVLCLQEIAQDYPGLAGGGDFDQPARVAALLPGYQVFYTPGLDELRGDGSARRKRFGNLIATRLPVLQVEHAQLPWLADASGPSMRRVCTVLTVQTRSGLLRVMTTHLEYFAASQRQAQTARLRALHAEANALARTVGTQAMGQGTYGAKPHTTRALLCGDFNCEVGTPEYAQLTAPGEDAFVDVFRHLHPGAAQPGTFGLYDHTYMKQPIACDFVFASPEVAPLARSFRVEQQLQCSDHQPVVVEFEGL